ncbi:MAG: lasso RiPP family leader peptide-containing protein [Pseudonocardiaceae bacterium]
MRVPYESPRVTVVGSIKDLTLGVNLTATGDNILGIPLLGGNNPPLS